LHFLDVFVLFLFLLLDFGFSLETGNLVDTGRTASLFNLTHFTGKGKK
jgi:hypothetical protein